MDGSFVLSCTTPNSKKVPTMDEISSTKHLSIAVDQPQQLRGFINRSDKQIKNVLYRFEDLDDGHELQIRAIGTTIAN